MNLKPLLKYPGGKTSELSLIFKNIPKHIINYIEPFVGGGAVYFSIKADKYFINDISHELMLLYKYVKSNNRIFFDELDVIINNWNKLGEFLKGDYLANLYIKFRDMNSDELLSSIDSFIDTSDLKGPMFNVKDIYLFKNYLKECLKAKFKMIKRNEKIKEKLLDKSNLQDNIEAGIKASYYTYLRNIYNKPKDFKKLSKTRRVAIYFFIREYCYSSMFRFNQKGEFNVPYGGISYNRKSLESKKKYFKNLILKKHLNKTSIYEKDFFDFLHEITINQNDFMFLDPPYDTTFSEYDKNKFNLEDQKRLANYLINECHCKFLLIIKKTNFIESLYKNKGLTIFESSKNYSVNFMDRNEKKVTHMIIFN